MMPHRNFDIYEFYITIQKILSLNRLNLLNNLSLYNAMELHSISSQNWAKRSAAHFKRRAMTLVEVSLVIAVMLGLISVLLIGFSAYKRGADRAICVQNISIVQKAMRSYSNLHANFPGDIVTGLEGELIGSGKFIDTISPCPGSGVYSFGGDAVPSIGTLYMNCTISEHVPSDPTSW